MPLNIDWQQILLHMFNFVLLFALLYFILYKPVQDFMHKREQHYRDLDEQSKKLQADAEAQKQEYDRLTADSAERLDAMEAQRRAEVEEAASKELSAAKEQARQIVEAARVSTVAEHEQMLRRAKEEIAQMAGDMAAKVSATDTSAAFDAFLNEAERGDGHAE